MSGARGVALQTIGLSVSEAVTFADKLVARGVVAVDGFDPPPGPFRLVSERLAADPRPVVGIRSSVTWSAHASGGPQVRLVTTQADAREAWRPLLDGSGQLLQVGPFTVRQTTDPTGTAFTWVEGATTYRLEGVGGSEADLTAVLRSLHAVDGSTWRQAVAAGQAAMASWPATGSAVVDGGTVSRHAEDGGALQALCLSGAGDRTSCSLVTGRRLGRLASVLLDGSWWLLGEGPAAGPPPTVLPDRGRGRLSGAVRDGRSWLAIRLPDDTISASFSFGTTTGTAGRPLA